MNVKMWWWGLGIVGVIAMVVAVGSRCLYSRTGPLIPLELLFGNPERSGAQLSPNGDFIAFLAPYKGVRNLWVQRVDDLNNVRVLTHDANRGISTYFWGYDNMSILYVQDQEGNENWNLYRLDIHTGAIVNLTPYPHVQVRILKRSARRPDELLVALNKESAAAHDVYRLNVVTGELSLVLKNTGTMIEWEADHDLTVRIATVSRDDGGVTVLHRWQDTQGWEELFNWDLQRIPLVGESFCFADNPEEVYCAALVDGDRSGLFKLNLRTKERELIASDTTYDVDASLLVHPETRRPIGLFIERERLDLQLFDESYRADIDFLSAAHEGVLRIISADYAFQSWLVGYVTSTGPTDVYLYHRENRQLIHLFCTQPALRAYTMAPMQAVQFQARDGYTLHGYLTQPVTPSPIGGYPTLLVVHGGPWARDSWGFSPEIQFFVNRGYACLQVNYRGSTGYGARFVNAGNKEWGAAMQDDLTDGVEWLIKQGVADAQRIGIYGGSYGGYAALAGAAFTPDLYRCAIDLVGVSNIITLLNSIPEYWKPHQSDMDFRVGSVKTDAAMLHDRSPLSHVDRMKIPILVAQGAHDPRVKQAEAEQIVAALRERSIPHEYLLFPDEGHGFVKPGNRLKFYRAAELFLAQHLGGQAEETGDTTK